MKQQLIVGLILVAASLANGRDWVSRTREIGDTEDRIITTYDDGSQVATTQPVPIHEQSRRARAKRMKEIRDKQPITPLETKEALNALITEVYGE